VQAWAGTVASGFYDVNELIRRSHQRDKVAQWLDRMTDFH